MSTSDEIALQSGTRWLIAYAHPSNGLGNKLGGLRGAYAIAHKSGRRLRIRWHDHQENDFLEPYDAADDLIAWSVFDGPGIASAPETDAVYDAWGWAEWPERSDGRVRWKKPGFVVPMSTFEFPMDANQSISHQPWNDRTQLCAPTLQNVHPRNRQDLEEAKAFVSLAMGSAPVVVMKSMTFDVVSPWTRVAQADTVERARLAYKELFRPREVFRERACQHLKHTLNLSFARPWIGLQIRRSQAGAIETVQTATGCRLCDTETTWHNESDLSHSDEAGIHRAVRCALSARRTLCMMRGEPTMCDAPIFVTSSSYRVLLRAVQLLGKDARYTANPDFVSHGGVRNGYLTPLLEMAVLSASRVIIGSAGSSYPLEAANMAGTTAIVKDFGLYHVARELRVATVQGECADPPTWPIDSRGSVLLPRGLC